jgi:hypothetical protein
MSKIKVKIIEAEERWNLTPDDDAFPSTVEEMG